MAPSATQPLAYLTDLPGIGGLIKQRREDFLVEELPLYEPTGAGEHLMLCVEKRGQTTSDVIRRLAKLFHVPRGKIGYAGLKDKHAIARQHFSIHQPDSSNDEKYLSRFEFTPFNLIWSQRHHNKLRRGHLVGNRFVIYVRSVQATEVLRAKAVLDLLIAKGVPNYVGHQRFGYRQSNHKLGLLLLLADFQALLDMMLGGPKESDSPATHEGRTAYDRGDYAAALEVWPKQLRHDRQALDALRQGKTAQEAVMAIDVQQREFLISAIQSAVFNDVLHQRLRARKLCELVPGDLAWKHDSRSVFAADQMVCEVENAPGGRIENFQVSPSGPMWGKNMSQPSGVPLEWENQILTDHGLSQAIFEQTEHVSVRGGRRPMRIQLTHPDVSGGADEHGPYIRLAFDLPRGSFATVVLREIMKDDQATAEGAGRGEDLPT